MLTKHPVTCKISCFTDHEAEYSTLALLPLKLVATRAGSSVSAVFTSSVATIYSIAMDIVCT